MFYTFLKFVKFCNFFVSYIFLCGGGGGLHTYRWCMQSWCSADNIVCRNHGESNKLWDDWQKKWQTKIGFNFRFFIRSKKLKTYGHSDDSKRKKLSFSQQRIWQFCSGFNERFAICWIEWKIYFPTFPILFFELSWKFIENWGFLSTKMANNLINKIHKNCKFDFSFVSGMKNHFPKNSSGNENVFIDIGRIFLFFKMIFEKC